ncbi:hypothetical protein [uncultured Devosia sp.]|uniref:hypothetical protein n=1 Tax=uncultured Devosia sp. TaxID=211434 RepID=UPI0035CC0D00
MQQDGRDDETIANDAGLHAAAPETRKDIWSRWPQGLVALTVIALGWVGIYLLWNGIVLLFSV